MRALGALIAVACLAVKAPAAEQILFDFTSNFDVARVIVNDAKVARAGSAKGTTLRVTTGHKNPWSGITLRAPSGRWDLSPYSHIDLRIRNTGVDKVTVFCRVDNPDGDGDKNSMTASVELSPKQSDTFKVTLARGYPNTLSGKLIGMNGYPFAPGGWNTINPRNITQLLIFVDTTADHEFEIDDIRASGSYTPATASVTDANPFFPFIDAFGQYRHKDWPGKVHSVAEFEQRRKTEAKEMAATPGPKDWCQYGGWAAGPQGKATGYFRTEKLNGKWWLVDPDGHLFFSHGIDTVMQLDTTPIDERGDWFADFPGTKPEFDRFLTSRHAWTGVFLVRGREPRSEIRLEMGDGLSGSRPSASTELGAKYPCCLFRQKRVSAPPHALYRSYRLRFSEED
jgi:hypothetical protein